MARLIDADALHKRLYKEFDHNSRLVGKQAVASAWQGAMQLLYDAPTIDPVKHGKWIDTTKLRFVCEKNVPVVMCAECGIRFCDLINNHHYMYHYCPHCGARMDGE